MIRQFTATSLSIICALSPLAGQELSISPPKATNNVLVRPYVAREVPPIRISDSPRLQNLVRGGNLYLTAKDAVALALENNVDIEIARYGPILAEFRVTRAEAGGSLPGVPSGASQVSSVASGQGVLGSQAAAGVSITGANGTNRATSNATVSQVGPVTQTLDPAIQETTAFSHRTLPQANSVQSVLFALIQNQRAYSGSYQQGFLSGGNVSVSYSDRYLNENAPTDLLNPSSAVSLSITYAQNLLQGFGTAVNGRTITVAKLNYKSSDTDFKAQVIGVVARVLNTYYSLLGDHENVRATRGTLETAKQFLADTKRRVELGAAAELDTVNAEYQAALAGRDLLTAQTTLDQRELQLKSLITRNSVVDPAFDRLRIVPLDHLTIPERDDLPDLNTLVGKALANRTDIASQAAGLETREVSALGTRNGLLPTLQVFGTTSQTGLAGVPRLVPGSGGSFQAPDPFLVGGIGTALGQVFRRNYPTEGVGVFFRAPIGNRQAQADFAIDQLQLRQSQLTAEKSKKQAQVDVQNAVIALQQARVRYDAAVRNRALAVALLEGEEKKLTLGASTSYAVIQQQRDLVTAQYSEISALVSYANAKNLLDQNLGTILEANGIKIAEVAAGQIAGPSTIPADAQPKP